MAHAASLAVFVCVGVSFVEGSLAGLVQLDCTQKPPTSHPLQVRQDTTNVISVEKTTQTEGWAFRQAGLFAVGSGQPGRSGDRLRRRVPDGESRSPGS